MKKIAILSILIPCLIIAGFVAVRAGDTETPGRTSGTNLAEGAKRTVVADVVAIDQMIMANRLGAMMPKGMIYALKSDCKLKYPDEGWVAGNVSLKSYKRPRPIVLRANVGDILEINFENYLRPVSTGGPSNLNKVGVHVMGLDLVGSINSDGTWVGANPGDTGSLTPPTTKKGEVHRMTYRFYCKAEGNFLVRAGSSLGPDEETDSRMAFGLFGNVTVQPQEAEWYRSQVSRGGMYYSTLRSDLLPGNMSLRQESGKPKVELLDELTGDVSESDVYLLTTYKTRNRLRAIKEAQVVIRTQKSKLFFADAYKDDGQVVKLPDGPEVPIGGIYVVEPSEREMDFARVHPLINYRGAVFPGKADTSTSDYRPEGTPVLNMLQAVAIPFEEGGPVEPKSGKARSEDVKKEYAAEIESLDSGMVPGQVRDWFLEIADVELTENARASIEPFPFWEDRYQGKRGYRWSITDKAQTYLFDASQNAKGTGDTDLNIFNGQLRIVYTDLTAIITGPNAGRFPYSNTSPSFYGNPASPDRRQPYREFNIGYHNAALNQAFPILSNIKNFSAGADEFGINYGFGGIGAEIVANRLGVGPMGINDDEVELKFEEFFLSSWAVGDPAMVVDKPANMQPSGIPDLDKPENQHTEEFTKADVQRKALMAEPPEGTIERQLLDEQKARAVQGLFPNTPPVTDPALFAPLAQRMLEDMDAEKQDARLAERAQKVFYPDDPSNVYHSYMRDHCKFRIYNAGTGAPHVHHLHAHQWLHTPNSDNGHYLDSQMITAGVGYTLEITYNGAGNRNQTVGDSIFHCHFYPHFARGMWSLWRVHDVFEEGTILDKKQQVLGKWDPDNKKFKEDYASLNRALPDGELLNGSPIPALVPLPTLGMAPLPAYVSLSKLPDAAGANAAVIKKEVPHLPESQGRIAAVLEDGDDADGNPIYRNPGYPFFIPGVGGHRAPHPPLDFAVLDPRDGESKQYKTGDPLDGGLPRHIILGGDIVREFHTRWDFSKDFILYDDEIDKQNRKPKTGGVIAVELPEDGTLIEKVAMAAHATRTRATHQPNGDAGNFTLNGLPPVAGAPFADPGVDDDGNAVFETRRYKAAVIQKDVVLNKEGWHYPQQRIMTLWGDIDPTFKGDRPPEPFFFRAHSGETLEFWHCNLVPDYYDLDDFQVRTPTDIIAQHIHLVKFDVTASDGGGNGFNYEDGTFSPDEVRNRIDAINRVFDPPAGGPTFYSYDPATYVDWTKPSPNKLEAKFPGFLEIAPEDVPKSQNWIGAQATVQRWATDPLLDNEGKDRTLRTVFTHDHFGPSTHQQVGLYAGLLIEPQNTIWRDPVTNERLYHLTEERNDGGPTSWQAIIEMPNPEESYREFALEFQDLQLAYTAQSTSGSDKIPQAPRHMSDISLDKVNPILFNFKPKPPIAAGQDLPQSITSVFAKHDAPLNGKVTVLDGPAEGCEPSKAGNATWVITNVDTVNGESKTSKYCVEDFYVQSNIASPPNHYHVTALSGSESAPFDIVYQLFPGSDGLPVPDPARVMFADNGITLSGEATYKQTETDPLTFEITDNKNYEDFPILVEQFQKTIDEKLEEGGFNVLTPELLTWADPKYAINIQTTNYTKPAYITSPQLQNEVVNMQGVVAPYLVSKKSRVGTYSINYRNEPLPLRVDGKAGTPATDLTQAYASIERDNPRLNSQPPLNGLINPDTKDKFPFRYPNTQLLPTSEGGGVPAGSTVSGTDPYTPILRAYENDKVEIRTLVGAHTTTHAFDVERMKWLFEPSAMDSGYRATQGMGLSEHFEMNFKLPPASPSATVSFTDYLYRASGGTIGQTSGLWGIIRSYDGTNGALDGLEPLPKAANSRVGTRQPKVAFKYPEEVQQEYTIFAAKVNDVLKTPDGLIYNSRGQMTSANPLKFDTKNLIKDGNAVIYTLGEITDPGSATTQPTYSNEFPSKKFDTVEPLVIRANAGDWIKITLKNKVPKDFKTPNPTGAELPFNALNNLGKREPLGPVEMAFSTQVGIRPQLVAYDGGSAASGLNVGYRNQNITVPAGESKTFYWYAGELLTDPEGNLITDKAGVPVGTPIEFGSVNLEAADPLVQHQRGLIGSLIVEPEGANWELYPKVGPTSTSVRVTNGAEHFMEFVALIQDNISFNSESFALTSRPPWTVNYRCEHLLYRSPSNGQPIDRNQLLSNTMVTTEVVKVDLVTNTAPGDPQSPVFVATTDDPVRFRVLFPAGIGDNTNKAIEIDGHSWQEEPWQEGSTRQGFNPVSQTFGSQFMVPGQPLNLLLDRAGGAGGVTGDYLFSSYMRTVDGNWCIMRVVDPPKK